MSLMELELVVEKGDQDRIVDGMTMGGTREPGGWDRRFFIDSTTKKGTDEKCYWLTIHDDDTDDESAVRTTPEEVLAMAQAMTEWAERELGPRGPRGTFQKPPIRLDTERARRRGVR